MLEDESGNCKANSGMNICDLNMWSMDVIALLIYNRLSKSGLLCVLHLNNFSHILDSTLH